MEPDRWVVGQARDKDLEHKVIVCALTVVIVNLISELFLVTRENVLTVVRRLLERRP